MPKSETWFQPGNGGGPGRHPLTPDEKQIREATRTQLLEEWELVRDLDASGLKKIIEDPKSPALRAIMALTLLQSFKKGWIHLEPMLTRLIGRPKEHAVLQIPRVLIDAEFKDL